MVFWPNPCVDLHVRLRGDRRAASAQRPDRPDIAPKSSFPGWKRMGMRRAAGEGFHA
ncbi:hypothetical protein TRIP_B360085 [uncultured Desulfatiglans sp.]|uniref:Uncharacterized protein n=1 Tax=Uncultured Desulfatiglans sp. TaxID=1748965 RepID=A0A653A036_UNCDX|nr:hypothetical protein TRIP_B10006 [uncultured Desulfatiglans sp.]VBB45992.1 hypothetical protein TRIP_B360085 [uncultured Desulfatiglans sp.]